MRIAPRLLLGAMVLAAASCARALPSGPPPPPVAMLARADWGAKPPAGPMRPHEIRSITIHHTATLQQPNRSLADKMRALQEFSQCACRLGDGRTKAVWADIPYHFYVDHSGRVAEGREVRYAGDTNTSYDPSGHLLIVLEGNFEEEQPTPAQLATLHSMVAHFAAHYHVPAERIDGHKDHASTLCPGRHLYERLPELRARVRAR